MSDGPTQTPESKIVFFYPRYYNDFFFFFFLQTSVAVGSVFVCYVVVGLLHYCFFFVFSRPIVVGSVVFPALCTCICVLVLCIFVLTHRDIIFDVLEPPAFKKYGTHWVFQALWNCVFLYVQEYLLLSLSSQSVCGYQGSQAFRKYMV